MCRFEHVRFDECGHRVIQVSPYCAERLWAAGMSGSLLACKEPWYTPSVLEASVVFDGRWSWLGMKGFCLGCRHAFGIEPSPFPLRSFNDEVFTRSSTLSESWTEPFIHLPELQASVPELTGLARQYRTCFADSPREEGAELRFKQKFHVYKRELPMNRMQWLRGDLTIEEDDGVREHIYTMMGFSSLDLEQIGKAMAANFKGSVVYLHEFKKRGMPRKVFDDVTRRLFSEYKETVAKKVRFVDNCTA